MTTKLEQSLHFWLGGGYAPAMRTPLQTRSESSADRMLAATLALLDEGGQAAVTVAAVARAAGTSNGSLYHRFGDRHGLLLAAQARALSTIEAKTATAFAEADTEPDDERAVALLAAAAVDLFVRHRGSLRAFLVDAVESEEVQAASTAFTHRLAGTVAQWLQQRFDCGVPAAQAAWRMLFALGASRALFDDDAISATPLSPGALADALGRAVLAVVR